jgi:hypothetical protein
LHNPDPVNGLQWFDQPNSIPDADNLAYEFTTYPNPLGFSRPERFVGNDVYPSQFEDPQLSFFGGQDLDDQYFDRRGNTISYFSGHGWVSHSQTGGTPNQQFCTHDTSCDGSPNSYLKPAGMSYPGFCQRLPGDNFGYCTYTEPLTRSIQVNNNYSGANAANRNGRINYAGNPTKWGDSIFSGGWAGAGTNGGTNFVGLAISCGSMSHRESEIYSAFGGVHMIGTVFTHTGDTANDPNRGYWFASGAQIPSSYASSAWLDAINDLPGYDACGNDAYTFRRGSGSQSYGGGHGNNGCGGHNILALGATVAEATGHINETWYDLVSDRNDAKGNGYYASYYSCNYDCAAWPFNIP